MSVPGERGWSRATLVLPAVCRDRGARASHRPAGPWRPLSLGVAEYLFPQPPECPSQWHTLGKALPGVGHAVPKPPAPTVTRGCLAPGPPSSHSLAGSAAVWFRASDQVGEVPLTRGTVGSDDKV